MADGTPPDEWEGLWREFASFYKSISRYHAVNINATEIREEGKHLVQRYFRSIRPELLRLGLTSPRLVHVDGLMQNLMKLSNGPNKKGSYMAVLRDLRKAHTELEVQRELLLGMAAGAAGSTTLVMSTTESRILQVLQELVSSAGASYQQALVDLQGTPRVSYRGTADELREALREVLDHLAPDAEVTKSEGFTLEKGRTRPTMRQKARFILKSRDVQSGALSSTQDAISRIEEGTAALARSVYERGSLVSHVTMTKREVMQLKMYVEAVLAELLQIH